MSWLSGTGRDAAIAAAKVAAPEAYLKMMADRAGLLSTNLDLSQTLAFLNQYRRANGLPPIADIGAVPSNPNARTEGAPLSFAGSQNPGAGTALPGSAAPTHPPANMPPQRPGFSLSGQNASLLPAPVTVAPLAPPPGTPVDADRSALFSRLAASTPAMALPTSGPVVTPVSNDVLPALFAANGGSPSIGNPLTAQRSFIGRVVQAMAGLPKYATAVPDYLKLLNQGVPEGAVIGPDGIARDAISGAPIRGDVVSFGADKAGAIAEAQQAPHVAAETILNSQRHGYTLAEQTHSAELQRGTDANRFAVENAYKPPVLMRAPDGSIVGVTPTQMANAQATPGALNGYRPLTDEETKALGAMGEQYVKDQAALPDLRQTQNSLRVMLDQAKAFEPGTFGDIRASAGRLLTGLGADADAVAKITGNPAGADVIMKNTLTLAMNRLRQSFGQSREAGFIVEKAMQANPNIATQPEAYSFMLNLMDQEAQRQVDFITGEQAYRKEFGTIDGYAEAFDQAHPVEAYFNQAMANTYGVPPGSRFLGRAKGRPVFQASNGQKFMVTEH